MVNRVFNRFYNFQNSISEYAFLLNRETSNKLAFPNMFLGTLLSCDKLIVILQLVKKNSYCTSHIF